MPWANAIWSQSVPIINDRGYLIVATNTSEVDYVRCATMLAHSIKKFHPIAHVSLLTDHTGNLEPFDQVIALPCGDQGGFANDWQVFHASPYRQTIKLEADMILTSEFDHWWSMFQHRDVVISQGCRNYHNQISNCRAYRRFIDSNHLPDVYNAITYWRRSSLARDFFNLVREIFQNWSKFRHLVKFSDQEPTTDFVYAMAAQIIGPDQVTLPPGYGPTIVHMKKQIIGTQSEDWTKELVWETDPLRVQTVAQWGMFHYHNKEWQHG